MEHTVGEGSSECGGRGRGLAAGATCPPEEEEEAHALLQAPPRLTRAPGPPAPAHQAAAAAAGAAAAAPRAPPPQAQRVEARGAPQSDEEEDSEDSFFAEVQHGFVVGTASHSGDGAKGDRVELPSATAAPAAAAGAAAATPHAAAVRDGALGQLRGIGAVRTACGLSLGVVAILVQYWARSRRKDIVPAEEEAETPMATEQVLRLPQPTPRLRQVGTSFAVPLSRIAGCKGASLNVDIPVSPAVWPLRALFSRHPDSGADAPWTRFQLTVDIIDAAGLPPLLCCDRGAPAPGPPNPAETGGTQQRYSSWASGCVGGDTGSLDGAEATASPRGDSDNASCLEVRGGSGAVAATLAESSAGRWKIQRPGHVSWDVERRDAAEGILFTAYCRGEEVALATRQLGSGNSAEDECVQVDTLMDSSSPDSLLLFCCMLALMAKFGPE